MVADPELRTTGRRSTRSVASPDSAPITAPMTKAIPQVKATLHRRRYRRGWTLEAEGITLAGNRCPAFAEGYGAASPPAPTATAGRL